MTAGVCVCIPTFKRPLGLRRALSELPRLIGDFDIHVVVADNDPIGADGYAVCRDLAGGGYPLRLTAVVARDRGVAHARNVLVQTALKVDNAPFIAMLDDDSWPAVDWLEVLVRLLRETNADMACPTIVHAYETTPGADVAALNEALRKRRYAEGRVPILFSTCGLVARRSVFEALEKPWFQPDYGLSGGEDDDFFLRASGENFTFAFSPRAAVTEFVPASRGTRQFICQRAFAHGASWTHIRLRRRPPGWSYRAEVGKILAGFAVGVATYAVMFWSPRHRLAAQCRILRAAGKVNGLMGNLAAFYTVHHGK